MLKYRKQFLILLVTEFFWQHISFIYFFQTLCTDVTKADLMPTSTLPRFNVPLMANDKQN